MDEIEKTSTLKRLQNRYRLIVMNDDTYQEVITFRLSRISVYIASCVIFVLMVSITVALMVLTPLKYYIPGYGSSESKTALQTLKMRTDSLEQAIRYKDQYLNDIKKVLRENMPAQLDTTKIKVPKPEISND